MSKSTVLIIDNDPDQLKEAVQLLEAKGMKVFSASDARGALEILRQSLPKMVLVDTGLFGIDGLTIARILKNDPDTSKIIVLAFTSSHDPEIHGQIKASGCDGFIQKPINREKFAAEVKSYFPGFW
jgi:two-component system cell cycle response regulator DivK